MPRASDRDPRPARGQSTALMTAVMATMIALVIVGFGVIAYLQSDLSAVRESSRQMRMARQAVMEANSAVLSTLAFPKSADSLVAYARALQKLEVHPPTVFPPTITHDDEAVPVSLVLGRLHTGWRRVMAEAQIGNLDAARASYRELEIGELMDDLIADVFAALNALESRFAGLQGDISLTMTAVVTLQIIAGLLCIAAFSYAARRSAREAKARARAVVEANASRDQVERLFQMTDMLHSAADHADANAVLRATAADLIPGHSGALYVFSNSRDRLALSTIWGDLDPAAPAATIALDQCWALKRGKPHFNGEHIRTPSCDHHHGAISALEIPMIARGEILGLLVITGDDSGDEESLRKVLPLGTALADGMSLALANIALREKLRGQALRDPLTGLYNRRYLEDAMERLTARGGRALSVVMIDLDHFKRLNDQYGHAKGDAVLRGAAAALTKQLRDTDIACRYGGEELIVLMPDCGIDDAAAKAEAIRVAIHALSEPDGADVSASLGVAAMSDNADDPKDLLAKADAALYLAKQSGRNRVVTAPPRLARMTADADPTPLRPERRAG